MNREYFFDGDELNCSIYEVVLSLYLHIAFCKTEGIIVTISSQ